MNTRDCFWNHTNKSRVQPFTPRIDQLQALNGLTFSGTSYADLRKLESQIGASVFQCIKWQFEVNNLDMSACILSGKVGDKGLGKWLSHAHIPEAIISKVCVAKTLGIKLTLSTRYKDFARMSDSKHFKSCIATGTYGTISYYLRKPNVFLLLNRGNDGDFLVRVVGRLTRITADSLAAYKRRDEDSLKLPDRTLIIIFNRPYTSTSIQLPSTINGIPCYMQYCDLYPFKSVIDVSERLVRYEVGPEELGQDPHDLGLVYDDLMNNRSIFPIT